ncbi:MAG: precorrin-6Y C5,15-methyltransferase (decarboxylating) subunit CbiT [Candidatus Nezhaarchaeota archaeon]|nr:precorrin-6Y C5,15-methyltransferase (decarboxylating) subunit CbiT [Candidatus Nezhaarchaeota archaeon]
MWSYKTPGIPDELFITSDKVPGPTKEEVRVVTISKARLKEGCRVADVGCGVGSITVEAALIVGSTGRVYAIDKDEEAIRITKLNVAKFGVQDRVQVILGKASKVLELIPEVDSIIIGGGRPLSKVLEAAVKRLKFGGRIVINAVTVETASRAIKMLKKMKFSELEVVNVSIAKGKLTNAGTIMLARNPVFVISASKS